MYCFVAVYLSHNCGNLGMGFLLGYENVLKLYISDDCTTLIILKADDLNTSMINFMVSELYLSKALTLRRAIGNEYIIMKTKFSQNLKINQENFLKCRKKRTLKK